MIYELWELQADLNDSDLSFNLIGPVPKGRKRAEKRRNLAPSVVLHHRQTSKGLVPVLEKHVMIRE